MAHPKTIVWFRQDLRLHDNPALTRAADQGEVIPIYIWDEVNPGDWLPGSASQWWLHHALESLKESLDNRLLFFKGDPKTLLPELAAKTKATSIVWNRTYSPWQITRDTAIKAALTDAGITVESFNASLLWEPWTILKKDKTPYKVFTPFYRKGCLAAPPPRKPLPAPSHLALHAPKIKSEKLTALALRPSSGHVNGAIWDEMLEPHWEINESAAHEKLDRFLKYGLKDYKEGRNFPTKKAVSQLSPYLHFGQISPNVAWYRALKKPGSDNLDCFCSELGWREFSYNLLYHNPSLPTENLQTKFDHFEWRRDKKALRTWQQGKTGIPFVDAGMRELWQTGYMHNRVRMVAGSFLVKNLRLDWREGEKWFWDCLVDADLASNSASWQWVAGTGADAAPYFRIFNPVSQGQKFDPSGEYTRHWLPELSKVPIKYLFNPWEAPDAILKSAGVTLNKNYPRPIVDLKTSRVNALNAFAKLKTSQQ
jgi:deoxyribodipyrimidine photo-lyase